MIKAHIRRSNGFGIQVIDSSSLTPNAAGFCGSAQGPDSSSFFMLVDDLAGGPEAIHPDREPAIGGDLREHGADLVGGEPVAQRPAGVALELLHFPTRRDPPEIEDRALARAERRVAPDLAPAVLREDALEVAVEVVEAVERTIHIGVAQHLAAHGHALVVSLLVHLSLPPSHSPSSFASAASMVS